MPAIAGAIGSCWYGLSAMTSVFHVRCTVPSHPLTMTSEHMDGKWDEVVANRQTFEVLASLEEVSKTTSRSVHIIVGKIE